MVDVYSPAGSARVLRNAVKYGLIAPLFPIDWADPLIRRVGGALLASQIPTKDPDLQRPYQNPKSQVYWEHHFDLIEQPEPAPQLPEWCVELARFPVPFGNVGILKSIEQYLYNNQETITQSANWGIPYQEQNVGAVRWHLRLSPFDGTLPARFQATGSSWLPGSPYIELPEINHFWYPASSPLCWLNSIVPGGYVLRFFFYAPADIVGRVRVMGRLRGYYQSNYSKEAAWNARTNW